MNDYADHVSTYTLTELPLTGEPRGTLEKAFAAEGWAVELREVEDWRDALRDRLAAWFFTWPDYVTATAEQLAALAHVRETMRQAAVPQFLALLAAVVGEDAPAWEAIITQPAPLPFDEGEDERYVEALDRGDEAYVREYERRYDEHRRRHPPRPLVEQNFLFRSGDRLLLLELGFDD